MLSNFSVIRKPDADFSESISLEGFETKLMDSNVSALPSVSAAVVDLALSLFPVDTSMSCYTRILCN